MLEMFKYKEHICASLISQKAEDLYLEYGNV